MYPENPENAGTQRYPQYSQYPQYQPYPQAPERQTYPDYQQPYPQYGQYPQYPVPVYTPPPPPSPPRRRPNVALRMAVSLLAIIVTLSAALLAVGVATRPALVTHVLPVTATRVSGVVYGQSLAQLDAGRMGSQPLAGASIDCGQAHTRADAQGRYSLLLLRGRDYTCQVSAPRYTTVSVSVSPHYASAYHLDLGPAIASSSDTSSAAGAAATNPTCAIQTAAESCPALTLVSGALSGQVIDSHTYSPIPNAPVVCWDNSPAAQASDTAPTRYSGDTDAQGRYTLREVPAGNYLCVANLQGAPQPVVAQPATTTVLNFNECGSRCHGVSYHTGPIMHSFTAYVIFWSPPGFSMEPGNSARFEQLTQQYLDDVGGTRFFGLLTQYWDQQGPVRNSSVVGGVYVDQQPYPHAGTRGDPLSDDDVTAEIDRVKNLEGWKVTDSSAFIVIPAYNVQECAKFSNGEVCSFPNAFGQGFCAYHSYTPYSGDSNSPDFKPYIYIANNYDCTYLPSFNSAPAPYGDQNADAVINSLSHEQFESITDPQTRGWYDNDPSGGEIADKCETTFGSLRADGSTVTLNNGHSYVLQEEYSNRAGGCAYQ
jgi:hypothetical protein